MKFVNREASPREGRFWILVAGLTWGSLFTLLALYLAGVV